MSDHLGLPPDADRHPHYSALATLRGRLDRGQIGDPMGYDDSYVEPERDAGGLHPALSYGVIFLVLAGIGLVFLRSSGPTIHGRLEGNESSAIASLRGISNAQTLHREGDKDNDGTLDYAADLRELGQRQLIDPALASGTRYGYVFETHCGPQPEFQWFATADPQEPGETGLRFFYVDQTGVIYYSKRGPIQGPLDVNKLPAGVLPLDR